MPDVIILFVNSAHVYDYLGNLAYVNKILIEN